ncbi:MAG: YbaB/EbfC family nucleoid-associated protein [Clostridiales bacterium]|jgi:DNA-binding YbaB/EbfC family protein|nr:YbaB/EbfC family nucleoid-associated protein [Clostridiales bacterium]
MAYGGRGGYGGGGGGMNMQAMMKQARALQEQMAKAQEELENSELTGTSGGGLVSVTITGKKHMTGVSIKPEAVDADDLEMLEDLIVAAFNDAVSQAEALEKQVMPMGAI